MVGNTNNRYNKGIGEIKMGMKWSYDSLEDTLGLTRYRLPKLAYWLGYDMLYGVEPMVYGIYLYCGEIGQGKTLSMVEHAKRLMDKGLCDYCYSNLDLSFNKGCEGKSPLITDLDSLVSVEGGSIVCLDEAQATFSSRLWKDFSPEVLLYLTQSRKRPGPGGKRGVRLLMTAQWFDAVDKVIRELATRVIQCNAYFNGRLVVNRYYTQRQMRKNTDNEEKMKTERIYWFIADNQLRNCYDTMAIMEQLKHGCRDGLGIQPGSANPQATTRSAVAGGSVTNIRK